jgi:WD40 repeat protein
MAIHGKARELIQHWHELRGKGQVLTAEELCRNHPECLPAVRQQIERQMKLGPLLWRWQQAQQQGRPIAPEELCRNTPELLEPLREQIRLLEPRNPTPPVNPAPPIDTEAPPGTAGVSPPPSPKMRLEQGAEPIPGCRLVQRLGSGGFGEVWRAVGQGGVPMAVKFLRLGDDAADVEITALERMKNVRHANLLALFGAWRTQEYLILTMELADGTLFDRFLQARQQGHVGIPMPQLLDYLRDAARGIDFLNDPRHTFGDKSGCGIQHRDIKPQNLLLVGDSVKVADFGLAKFLERTITRHTGYMTPAYAAPEFFNGEVAPQSDQYSLAVTYCQLRGGKLPFSGPAAQLISGHLMQPPDLTMLPDAERPVIARALSKIPPERWPNCRAFVEALAAISQSSLQTVTADHGHPTPSRAASLTAAPSSRRKMLYGAVAGALVVLLGVFGYSLWRGTPAPTAEGYAGEVRRFSGHKGAVAAVAFSPDGEYALSGGVDKTVRLWKVATGEEVRSFGPHDKAVRAVAFAPDGQRAVSGSEDETVRVWEVSSGRELKRFKVTGGMAVDQVLFSHDGRKILAVDWLNDVHVWDLEKGEKERHRELQKGEYLLGVTFAPNGNPSVLLLANVVSKEMTITVNVTRIVAVTVQVKTETGVRQVVQYQSVVTPEKRTVINVQGNPLLYDMQKGEGRQFGKRPHNVLRAAFSHDGKRLLTWTNGKLRLWDVASGEQMRQLVVPWEADLGSLMLSSDARLALVCEPRWVGYGQVIPAPVVPEAMPAPKQPDGKANDEEVSYQPPAKIPIEEPEDPPVAPAPALTDGAFQLWDVVRGRLLRRFAGHQDTVTSVAFSPKGRFILSGSLDGTIRLWVYPDPESVPAAVPGEPLRERPLLTPILPGGVEKLMSPKGEVIPPPEKST